jgi:hypothetical protein
MRIKVNKTCSSFCKIAGFTINGYEFSVVTSVISVC